MTAAAWIPGLQARMKELNRWIMDRVVTETKDGGEWVPAERYRDVAFLRSQIARGADMSSPMDSPNPDVDVRVALSRFVRQYSSSVVSTAQVALGCGLGIDLSAERCTTSERCHDAVSTTLPSAATTTLRTRSMSPVWRCSCSTPLRAFTASTRAAGSISRPALCWRTLAW